MSTKPKSLKIIFWTFNFVGPQNACIGLAQELKQRGHQIYFCLTKEFYPKFNKYGFDTNENLLLLETSTDVDQDNEKLDDQDEEKRIDSLKEQCELLMKYGFVSNKTPFEKLRPMIEMDFIGNTFDEPLRKFDLQFKNYLIKINPDLIIYDGEIISPTVLFYDKCPWIYLFCSNPLGLFDSDQLPPFTSDYPANSDPKSWEKYRKELDDCLYKVVREAQAKLCLDFNYGNIPSKYKDGGRFFIRSPYLNLYQFPKELDYDDKIMIDPNKYFRVDSFVRYEEQLNDDDSQWFIKMPKKFLNENRTKNSRLIYFSLGSMGSCNISLMNSLLKLFSKYDSKINNEQIEYLWIISKGKSGDLIELPDDEGRMYGKNYIPQCFIFKNLKIDLAILHGGNNSLTEAFYFGIPVLILPLFYDQFSNARRVEEKKYGYSFNPFEADELDLINNRFKLYNILDKIFKDEELNLKFKRISYRIQNDNTKMHCCEKLEKIVNNFFHFDDKKEDEQ